MEIRELIITLDRMCQNSRNLAMLQDTAAVYQEEAEVGELALNIMHALQMAGATTTGGALALLRTYSGTVDRCATLRDELVQAKKHISDLCVKNRMQALMLGTYRTLLEMPGMVDAVASTYVGNPTGGIKAFRTALEKMQNAVPFFAEEAVKRHGGNNANLFSRKTINQFKSGACLEQVEVGEAESKEQIIHTIFQGFIGEVTGDLECMDHAAAVMLHLGNLLSASDEKIRVTIECNPETGKFTAKREIISDGEPKGGDGANG